MPCIKFQFHINNCGLLISNGIICGKNKQVFTKNTVMTHVKCNNKDGRYTTCVL